MESESDPMAMSPPGGLDNTAGRTVTFDESALLQSSSSATASVPFDKFKVKLADLLAFIFPAHLQHPYAATRLFAAAFYGPLDENLQLRTGFKQSRVLLDYELDAMCLQLEREDIIQIYLHRSRDMGLLSSQEEEAIIAQADGHLKKAKGRALLPAMSRKDVIDLLSTVPRDEYGRMNFHELQRTVEEFRRERIKQYKLVYPSLANGKKDGSDAGPVDPATLSTGGFKKITFKSMPLDHGKVSEATAPRTMFQKMQGLSNADIIDKNTSYLSKHAYKIYSIGAEPSNESALSNIRLLREVAPRYDDPNIKKNGTRKIPTWSTNALLKNSAIGSLVDSAPSSSTWKRTYTSY